MLTLILITILIAALLAYISIPFAFRLSKKMNLYGIDVHKEWKPPIPKIGGISIVISVIASTLILSFLFGLFRNEVLAFTISSLSAAVIGFYEDFKELNPIIKPLLLAFCGFPIIFFGAYYPYPDIPFIGRRALSIVYPILIYVAFSIVTNAINGMDVLNGSMGLTSLVVSSTMLLISSIKGDLIPALLSASLVGSLAVFGIYNKYPAKLFSGNVGSLFVGACLISVAIIGSVEVAFLIAILPQIMNEFHIIYSMRGIKSAKAYPERPIIVNSGLIHANPSRKAPLTLVRMIAARRPLSEKEIVEIMVIVCLFSAALAIFTEFLL